MTSFGLALATWMRRVGRAIAASVATYAIINLFWLVALRLQVVPSALSWLGLLPAGDEDAGLFFTLITAGICPLGAGHRVPIDELGRRAHSLRILHRTCDRAPRNDWSRIPFSRADARHLQPRDGPHARSAAAGAAASATSGPSGTRAAYTGNRGS